MKARTAMRSVRAAAERKKAASIWDFYGLQKSKSVFFSFYDQFVCGAVSKGMRYDNTGYDCMAGAEWDIRRNCEIDIRCESRGYGLSIKRKI